MSWLSSFAAFCTLLIALSSDLVTANASDGQEMGAKFEELKRQARYPEAIELITQHIETLKNVDGEKNAELGQMFNRLGELNLLNGQIDRALEIYRNVVTDFSNLKGENRKVIRTALGNLTLLYMSIGQFDTAEKYAALMKKEVELASKMDYAQQPAIPAAQPAPAPPQDTPGKTNTQSEHPARSQRGSRHKKPHLAEAEPAAKPEKTSRNYVVSPAAAEPLASETAAHVSDLAPPAKTQAENVENVECPKPEVIATVTNSGVLNVRIVSTCLADRFYRISYGKYRFRHRLSSAGRDEQRLDLFAGTQNRISVEFEGYAPTYILVPKSVFENTQKVALVWDKAVDLDLHVFEYAAKPGEKGHIWSAANRTFEETSRLVETQKRAHGYISQSSSGKLGATNIEVYTLIRYPEQRNGAIALVLDFKSRGFKALHPFCGSNELASVPFKVYRLQPGGSVEVETGLIPAMACGQALNDKERYLSSTISAIDLRQH